MPRARKKRKGTEAMCFGPFVLREIETSGNRRRLRSPIRAPLFFQVEQAFHVGFLHGRTGRRQLLGAELLDLSFAADEFFRRAHHGYRAASLDGERLHALRRIGGLRFQK